MNVREHEYHDVIKVNDFKDDNTIRKEMKAYMLETTNMILKYLKKLSLEVICQLLKTYCTNFYYGSISLWKQFKATTMKCIEVAYKKMFRALTGVKKGKTYFAMIEINITTLRHCNTI